MVPNGAVFPHPTYVTTLSDLRSLVCTTIIVLMDQDWGEIVLNSTKTGRPAPSLIETEIDGDVTLYHPPTEQVTVLNGTASDVWRLCDGELTVEEITELLARSYGVSIETIQREVTETIRQFQEADLLST